MNSPAQPSPAIEAFMARLPGGHDDRMRAIERRRAQSKAREMKRLKRGAPRCPYCLDRTKVGSYGDKEEYLPAYFCPRSPGVATCPYAQVPVYWHAPRTEAQRAQAADFETRRDASYRAAGAWAVREMAEGDPLLWTYASSIGFGTLLFAIGLDLDAPEYHLPRWLLILLAVLLYAIIMYLRERHHATRREAWHCHLSPTMRPFKTTLPETTTTTTTPALILAEPPAKSAHLPRPSPAS